MCFVTRQQERGSTLVELIVSITLFLTVISIMIPTLFTTIKMQRNVNSLVRMHNSLSYSMEYIAKEIRTGKGFSIEAADKRSLSFRNYHGEDVTYRFEVIPAVGQTPERRVLWRQIAGQSQFALVSSDVKLNDFQFWVKRAGAGGEKQVSIMILANASPSDGFTTMTTQFQTTVTPLLRSDIIQ